MRLLTSTASLSITTVGAPMELSTNVITNVLTPLAVYRLRKPGEKLSQTEAEESLSTLADTEQTTESQSSSPNFGKFIDSLAPSPSPKWRLDGVDTDGRRFFAVPLFAIDKQPVRIDVWLPPFENYPRQLRKILKPEEAIYTPKDQLLSLPLSKFLLKTLEDWSPTVPGFEKDYLTAPFGSRIIIDDIATSIEDMTIYFVPDYGIEQNMCSVDQLKKVWHDHLKEQDWPPSIDLGKLNFKKQIHEAISLVTLPGHSGNKVVVFKSLLRDQRYMYNEIKTLLLLAPQKNLMPKPLFIVTKKSKFGGKKGIAGFVMEYFEDGSLKDMLLKNKARGTELDMRQKFRFASQLTEVLIHVNKHRLGFYPDLKPDNLVIRSSNSDEGEGLLDLVLLDLEQRGGWFSWSPPEVVYVEYQEILATWLGCKHDVEKQRVTKKLQRCIDGWEATSQSTKYNDKDGGFSFPWRALLKERLETGSKRLERAQVFMLGKLLWCLFEGEARVRCGIDHEVLQENDGESSVGFPQFNSGKTPTGIRDLIRDCTSGAPEWEVDEKKRRKTSLVLKGGKLMPAGTGIEDLDEITETVARYTTRVFWNRELDRADAFMSELLLHKRAGVDAVPKDGILAEAERRPLLSDVLARLIELEKLTL
ncbi:hypothetical protein B0T21DRAFT_367093 [Apiosordaria backusii]|uniref:Protein kinase domain-containing protein n=1 Tax=Apiosordaria backusii TaxID=314023 RepID=A0AA40BLT3_9PEZI|nr:hypothetical protein B0T21DRAFT_367093 [Apiosordaria backusii]